MSIWQAAPPPTTGRHPKRLVAMMLVLSVAFWFVMGATAIFSHQLLDGVPERGTLGRVTEMARSSVFYDHKGRPAFTIFKEQRIEIPLGQMSPHLKTALLAIEDQRFYDHHGVDFVRIAGAAVANAREGRTAQGGSTITQQLARMSFLTAEKTYSRKLQEIFLAALIETQYSKDQILELYLNKVYFGAGLYGAEAAALGYFGKNASELTVADSAMLAGLVKAPSNYAPTVDRERAIKRRTLVLQQMLDMRAIDQATFTTARDSKVVLSDALRKEEPYGRFFKEHVRRELIERFGEGRVYEGGLKVYTTMDIDMQRAADAEVQRIIADLDRRRGRGKSSGPLQASLIALDPRGGEVRALIGGRDFIQSNYNRALYSKRQPGSAFKPFVYAAALEAGYTPASVIHNLNIPIDTYQGAWVPEDEHSSASAMTIRTALKTSSNRAAVRMLDDLGIGKAVAYAQRVGVGNMPSVPSLALGAGEVTLESLTTAYSVFASAGLRRTATYIKRVEDLDGQVLYTAPYPSQQVISEQTAYVMTNMLADVVNHGTAYGARQLGFKLPAAGKTGTTNEYHDAWFVGYTPRLVTGVWVGFDQPATIMRGGYAAQVAVPLWAGFMRKATAGDPADWYKAPDGVHTAAVCRLSGQRPVEACYGAVTQTDDGSYTSGSTVYNEIFVEGTEPDADCPVHRYRAVEGRQAGWSGGVMSGSSDERRAEARRDDDDDDDDDERSRRRDRDNERDARQADDAPEKKKHGFWSRVFGRGGDDDKKDEKRKNKDDSRKDDRRDDERRQRDR
ncbi:MAG TPA: PBP1A family penicillin-binding protein [Vicinamibacterales bacterium]|nr:PBP1A family penicillin-binding protein [Vicinamibacterales bacterium]